MNKKAVFFSTDALVALMIILITILAAYPLIKHSKQETRLNSDILNALSSLKIGEMDNSYVHQLISQGKITDLNKPVLEQIGDFYSKNDSEAKTLAQEFLSALKSEKNIGVWYDNELLASINKTGYENAENIDVSRQTISGVEKGKVSKGFIAKAWLKKIAEKQTSLFVKGDAICGEWTKYSWGYYCGSAQNTIIYEVNVPENATIINAEWLTEGSWTGQYSKLYVNENKVFDGDIAYYKILNITSYIHTGNNTLKFYSTTGGDDGATHVVVDYKTPDMQTFEYQKIFPFNEVTSSSVLHYEKSIFLPGEIFNISIFLNSSKDVNLSFRKGAKTVNIGKKSPVNNRINYSNSEIQAKLNSAGISYSTLNNEYFFFILDIGNSQTSILGSNSYVEVDSSETQIPYGAIDITQKIPIKSYSSQLQNTFYRNLLWSFNLPVNSIPVIADWQLGWLSIDSGTNTQKAAANSIILYNSPPDDYLPAFSRFGYSPLRANGLFKEGENNFTLNFGTGYGVSYEASYGYLTYFVKNYVNYDGAFEKAKGGTRTITFEDNSIRQLSIGDPTDLWDPDKDAIDNAVERLLSQLDSNNNGKIDLILDQNSFDIDSLDISGVPYIWSTEVQVRVWD